MERITTIAALRARLRTSEGSVGLVPTMGNLHAGHLALAAPGEQCEKDEAHSGH